MSITTFDQWIAGAKQNIPWSRTAARTTVANRWFALHDLAGNCGPASSLSAGNTANGAVPTDATPGFPLINFSSGIGYLSDVDFGCTAACRLAIFDRLFAAGAYNFNDAVTLASQPSFGGRVPNSNYAGLQLWFEAVTTFTGNFSLAVTYTNQAGTAGQTTGTVAMGVAPTVGSMIQLPLQSGDTGIQKIESVTGTVSSAGTFNVLILRPLWNGRVAAVNGGDCHGPDRTGLPQVYGDSALQVTLVSDTTSSGLPDLQMCIVSG